MPRRRLSTGRRSLLPPEIPGNGIPYQLFREGLSGRVGVDEGFDARAEIRAPGVGEGAQDHMITFRSFLHAGFGKARNLQEPVRSRGVASRVEGGRGLGFVGSDGGVKVEAGGGADGDLDFV